MPQRIMRMNAEVASEAVKAAPPVAVVATSIASGWSINHIVGAATIAYIVLQAGYLVWRWRRDVLRERRERSGVAE